MSVPFHVACPYTGQVVCHCSAGSSVHGQTGETRHARQAANLWKLWQQQQKLFKPQSTVDIQLPKLVQRYKNRSSDDDFADGTMEAEAEKALRSATKAAEVAASKAMHAAALAGFDYAAPQGMQIETPKVEKVDSRQVERRAQAAQQSMQQRSARREKAQASAAAHAQMLAAQQSEQQQPHQPRQDVGNRASLQQMLRQNKDQIHQALESNPSWEGGERGRQQPSNAAPASSSARQGPKAIPAAPPKRPQSTKSRLSKQHDPEPPQAQQRNKPKSQPQSPSKPALSPSINPSIQAKLQQAHNKLLGPTRGGGKAEEGSGRPAANKPGGRSGNKAAAAAHTDGAWQEPPPRQMLLRKQDVQPAMQDKWLQLYWPDDGKWWPAQVTDVDLKAHKVHLLYETGEAEVLDLGPMVRKEEVAWLHKRDMPGSEPAAGRSSQHPSPTSPQQAGSKKRKQQKGPDVGQKKGKLYRDDSGSSMEHPGMAAPRRQRAAGGRNNPDANRQAGAAGRPQSADQNVMQVGMEAVFKLGSEAVGRNVHVFLSEHGSWYNARVKQCLPRQGAVHVQYESGDKDVLKAKEQNKSFNIRLMPVSARNAA